VDVITPGPGKPDPDLIVFSCGNDRHFTNVPTAAISERDRARIAEGAVGLVFDASTEGTRHKAHTTTEFHDVLRSLGASTKRAVYLTQDRQFEEDYRAYCASIGFESPVVVLNHDYWVWCAFSHYERDGEEVFQKRLEAFRARPSRRKRRFVSLNRTARGAKILFLLSLLRDGLWERALCHSEVSSTRTTGRESGRGRLRRISRGRFRDSTTRSPSSRPISMRSMRVAEYYWA
jgi:hypothetical protein